MKYPTIPTIITLLSACTAWIAILLFPQWTQLSILCILAAFLLDSLDGHVARSIHQITSFGRILDSLCDVVIYLIWPLSTLSFLFHQLDVFTVLASCLFLGAGIFRLARFCDTGYVNKYGTKGYPGLPVVFSLFYIIPSIIFPFIRPWLPLIFILHALLMIQTFPFPRPPTMVIISIIVLLGILTIVLF